MIYNVFLTILTMLFYALPGFLLSKTKLVSKDAPKTVTAILLYVLQPCLTVASFQKVTLTKELSQNLVICFFIALFLMGSFIAVFRFLLKKKSKDTAYRVANIGVAFSNASFIGIPILDVVLPDCKEAASYSMLFFLAMSALGWTVASAVITNDKKYISAKKIFLNPATISLVVALVFSLIDLKFSWKIPAPFSDMITLLGKMSTPLCMLVVGMRLASTKMKSLFGSPLVYFTTIVKLFIFPLFAFAVMYFLPIDSNLKICIFVMTCCPVAAVVQSFAELVGEGQESAANMVLLSSCACIVSVPIMLLLL